MSCFIRNFISSPRGAGGVHPPADGPEARVGPQGREGEEARAVIIIIIIIHVIIIIMNIIIIIIIIIFIMLLLHLLLIIQCHYRRGEEARAVREAAGAHRPGVSGDDLPKRFLFLALYIIFRRFLFLLRF